MIASLKILNFTKKSQKIHCSY